MKYIALLRGINVGGNGLVSMAKLKEVCEKAGLTSVRTYINSGNVLFESNEHAEYITKHLEQAVEKAFFAIKIIVLSKKQLQEVLDDVPEEWHKKDLRCYIACIKPPLTPKEILPEIQPKEGVDSVKLGSHVIYLSTKLSGLTKSGFTKLIGKKVYKEMTMRNYTTVKKLATLLE